MEQIAEEVKVALKPHFSKNLITKEEYKDIMRKAVPKVHRLFCSNAIQQCTSLTLQTYLLNKYWIIHLVSFVELYTLFVSDENPSIFPCFVVWLW